jgi:GT2 family glycosyltransferase
VRERLRECLQALLSEMLLPRSDYEVLVVDNASSDESAAMVRAEFPEVVLIESAENVGFGAGCNLAYRRARGEFVLLLNPDTRVIGHAADGLLALMRERPRAAIIAPRLVSESLAFLPASGGALPTLANTTWNYLFLKDILPARLSPPALFMERDTDGVVPVEWVSGASMLLRREAIGARIFDESFFMFGEDMDVCQRVRRDGWEVLFAGTHSIIHHHGQSFAKQRSARVRRNAHEGPRRVFGRGRGRASLVAYDAVLLAGHLIRWPLYALLGVARPGRGYAERARFARDYVWMLVGPGGP